MRGGWEHYGVKTLYRIEAVGRPRGKDRAYSREVTLVEERIVLLKARSFDEAIRKAEIEAEKYAADDPCRNRYGQRVRRRYLGYCDAYIIGDLSEEQEPMIEVFSSTEVVRRGVPDHTIERRQIGAREPKRGRILRVNFQDIVFMKPAQGVTLTRSEREFVEQLESLRRRARPRSDQ